MQHESIEKAIAKTLTALASTGAVLKGSVSKVTLGKRTRTRGNRVTYLLTYKGKGNITKSLYIRKHQVAEIKQMIRNYQKLKAALRRLLALNVNLFKARQLTTRMDRPPSRPSR